MTGICLRCRQFGRVQLDHPDGRFGGVPLFPGVVEPLCPGCHRGKGRWDRVARVEGGRPTVRLVIIRRAAWAGFLAQPGRPVLLPAKVLSDLAMVDEAIARRVPPDWPWELVA